MPTITGTIKDSSGAVLSGRLTVTLDGQLIDTTTTPDSILVPKPYQFTITSGVVNISLVESESKNLTYRFVFETSTTELTYYTQDGVLYTGPKNYTTGQWWTGSSYVAGTSQLLTEQVNQQYTSHFDFRAIVPNQPSVEFSTLVPTGLTTDILDTGLARLAEILTNDADYVEALRGGPRWQGNYNASTYYKKDDAVSYGGSSWVYINADPAVGQTPSDASPTYWQYLGKKGDPGGTGGNDTAYDATGWNGAMDAPSRNAVRDIIETLARVSQLAAYATLDSPAFVNNPTAPTQTTGNRSSRLATTQFVGNELDALGFVPIGALVAWTSTSPPTKWQVCDGRAISRTSFSALFALIGTTYGSGNGTTTFNLPDLRGRVPAGADYTTLQGSADRITASVADVMGGVFGAETHTLLVTEMPSHSHGNTAGALLLTYPGSGGTATLAGGTTVSTATLNSAGGGGSHNNVQPTIFLTWIIYTGV